MDIDQITKVINSDIPDENKRTAILNIISRDANAIPDLLEMLQEERDFKQDFIKNINFELSQSRSFIENLPGNILSEKERSESSILLNRIETFYTDYKKYIIDCFKKEN